MSKKKTPKKKSPYPENGKTRIRHSYYTFAREFPSKIQPLGGKRRKHRKKRILKGALLCLLFAALSVFSFFTVNLMLDISYTEKESTDSEQVTVPENETPEPLLPFDGDSVRALYMPEERLGDRAYIKAFIKQIKRKNCNSAVIDFKNSDGKLSFTSLDENAVTARCSLFDNNTVRQALDLFENEGIRVIARVYCFMDDAAASAVPEMAVKYMDTDVNWVDAVTQDGGRSRLNPVSKKARKYILNIVEEILQFKIDGILLEEVSFPTGEHISAATYPGEKKGTDRNKVLKNFVKDIDKLLPDDCILLVGHGASDILETNNTLYGGSMLTCDADGFAADTLARPEGITVDKKTDFASAFSLFSSVKNTVGEKKSVYIIDISEYSAALLRKMRKAGYTDYIIYSPEGAY